MTMAPFETVMTFDGSNVMLEQARLVVAGDRSVPERPDQPRAGFAVARPDAEGQRQSRQGDRVGAAAAGAGHRHGDDRRHDHRSGAQLRARPGGAQQHARRRARARARPGRTDARHLRRVLRPRPGDLAAIRRIDPRQVHRAVGQGVDQHRRQRTGAASTRKRRCGWPMSNPQAIGGALRGARHVRVRRAAALRDRESLDRSRRAATWCR